MIKIILILFVVNVRANNKLICGTIPLSFGKCGDDCEWSYNHNTKTLTINGTEMNDFYSSEQIPWFSKSERIENIIFDGITKIGMNSFINTKSLYNLTIPKSVVYIGKGVFSDSSLKNVVYEGLKNPCESGINAFVNIKTTSIVFVPSSYNDTEFCGLNTTITHCGENCRWSLESNTLEITGSGLMNDYINSNQPWYEKRNDIVTITVNGVSSIGSNAFKDCINLERVIV